MGVSTIVNRSEVIRKLPNITFCECKRGIDQILSFQEKKQGLITISLASKFSSGRPWQVTRADRDPSADDGDVSAGRTDSDS